jgi:hypothetical protein
MRLRYLAAIPLSLLGLPLTPALAHGGGLDANGCHTNRRTGDYHCHVRNRRSRRRRAGRAGVPTMRIAPRRALPGPLRCAGAMRAIARDSIGTMTA